MNNFLKIKKNLKNFKKPPNDMCGYNSPHINNLNGILKTTKLIIIYKNQDFFEYLKNK